MKTLSATARIKAELNKDTETRRLKIMEELCLLIQVNKKKKSMKTSITLNKTGHSRANEQRQSKIHAAEPEYLK